MCVCVFIDNLKSQGKGGNPTVQFARIFYALLKPIQEVLIPVLKSNATESDMQTAQDKLRELEDK